MRALTSLASASITLCFEGFRRVRPDAKAMETGSKRARILNNIGDFRARQIVFRIELRIQLSSAIGSSTRRFRIRFISGRGEIAQSS